MDEQAAMAETRAKLERMSRWDGFLDAYSAFMKEPTPMNVAGLGLAGSRLEQVDEQFSMREFKSRLGWSEAVL